MGAEISLAFFTILAGVSVLLLGRRIFWLFVGVVGFALGFDSAHLILSKTPELVALFIALLAGVVGAALAYFVQEALIVVVGFLAGAYVGTMMLAVLMPSAGYLFALAGAGGGVVGAVVVSAMFDWALIVLSSLIGAHLIVDTIHASPSTKALSFAAVAVTGILIQSRLLARRPHRATRQGLKNR
jgi:Domain of unknown function (DUF4203)